MRVGCGLVFIFIAACCGWAAFNWTTNAVVVANGTGVRGFVGRAVGEDTASTQVAWQYGVGAAIFGVIGMLVLASSGGSTSGAVERPMVLAAAARPVAYEPAPPPRPPSVEQRLANLKGLLSSGLISDQEYQDKRRQMLDQI